MGRSPWRLPTVQFSAVEAIDVTQLDYQIAGREAHCFGFDEDEFLRVELYDGYFSMHWTTALPLAAVVRRVQPPLRGATGQAIVFDEQTHRHEELRIRDAVDLILDDAAALSFARLELPELTLVWEQAAVSDGAVVAGRGELALLARVFDEDACVRALRNTATSRVAREATALIERVAYVAQHLARGRLAVVL